MGYARKVGNGYDLSFPHKGRPCTLPKRHNDFNLGVVGHEVLPSCHFPQSLLERQVLKKQLKALTKAGKQGQEPPVSCQKQVYYGEQMWENPQDDLSKSGSCNIPVTACQNPPKFAGLGQQNASCFPAASCALPRA